MLVAESFGPVALKAVRQKMIEANLAHTTVNKRINSDLPLGGERRIGFTICSTGPRSSCRTSPRPLGGARASARSGPCLTDMSTPSGSSGHRPSKRWCTSNFTPGCAQANYSSCGGAIWIRRARFGSIAPSSIRPPTSATIVWCRSAQGGGLPWSVFETRHYGICLLPAPSPDGANA